MLSDADIESMTVPAWERAKAALEAGDIERAAHLIDEAATRTRGLQVYSIEWITSLLSFIGRELGEPAVEQALRQFGDEFIATRRNPVGAPAWNDLPAEARAKAIARAMVTNGGQCEVSEDDDKIVLSFRCGSGGRLIDERRYDNEGGPYLTLHEAAGRTFSRDALPGYCAHCSVNNEIQPMEADAGPTSVEFPPTSAGEPCVHHVYRDPAALPDEVYVRLQLERPTSR